MQVGGIKMKKLEKLALLLTQNDQENISGAATQLSLGRGCTPKTVKYIGYEKGNISGAATQPAMGRGGTPKTVKYIGYKKNLKEND